MNNKAIFSLFVLLISVSCQKDSVPGTGGGNKSIVCSVSVSGAYDTKSAEVTSTTLKQNGQTFRMDAWLESENRGSAWPEFDDNPHYIKNAIMKNYGSQWKSGDASVVWTNQIHTNFWAQYPESVAGRDSLIWTAAVPDSISDYEEKTPSFFYDMSAYLDTVETSRGWAQELTPDLLVAYARELYEFADSSATKKLKFKFAHVLSAIKFSGNSIGATEYSIDTIRITGIYSKGTCHLTGLPSSGTSPDSVKVVWEGTATLDYGISFSQNKKLSTATPDSSYFFLIPQTLKSEAKLFAKVTANPGGDVSKNGWYDANIGGNGQEWKPGLVYKYLVKFDPSKHYLTVTVDEKGSCYSINEGKWN